MAETAPAGTIALIRDFNRFYTRQVGVLNQRLLNSPLTLTEGRVLYELAQRTSCTATEIASELSLDLGYLSRLLSKLERQHLVKRGRAKHDARRQPLSLTEEGRFLFEKLNRASSEAVVTLIEKLSPARVDELLCAMRTVRRLLSPATAQAGYLLRPLRVGDIGWIVHRQGVLYAEEYGWDATYEALVAEILSHFVKHFDPGAENAWVAERDGAVVGSIFLVKESARVAKLRLLYVEPTARGLGIGGRLVRECVADARKKGYETLALWTNGVLASARRIYQAAGFRLLREERHHSFGRDLVGQNWELTL